MPGPVYVQSLSPSGAKPVATTQRTDYGALGVGSDAQQHILIYDPGSAGSPPIGAAVYSGTAQHVLAVGLSDQTGARVSASSLSVAITGTPTVVASISGALSATITGQVTVTASVIGQPTVQASVTGQLFATASIAGTPNVVASVIGQPTVQASVVGQLTATVSVTGTPAVSVSNQVTVTASVIGVPTVIASCVGQQTVTASVIGIPTFIGSVQATQAGSWNITIAGSGIPLSVFSDAAGNFLRVVVGSQAGAGSTITGSVLASQGGAPWTANVSLQGQATVTASITGTPSMVGSVQATQTGSWTVFLRGSAGLLADVDSLAGGNVLRVAVYSIVTGGAASNVVASVIGNPTVIASCIGQQTVTASVIGIPTIVGSVYATQQGSWQVTIGNSGATVAVHSDAAGGALRVIVASNIGAASTITGSVGATQLGSWSFAGNVVASVIGNPTVVASVIGQPTVTASVIGQVAATASVIGNPTVIASVVGQVTVTASARVEGLIAHDVGWGQPGLNPLGMGLYGLHPNSGAPTAVQSGDVVRALGDLEGKQYVYVASGNLAVIQSGNWSATITGSVGATQLGQPWSVTGNVVASVVGQVTATASVIGQVTATVSLIGQPTVSASVAGQLTVTASARVEGLIAHDAAWGQPGLNPVGLGLYALHPNSGAPTAVQSGDVVRGLGDLEGKQYVYVASGEVGARQVGNWSIIAASVIGQVTVTASVIGTPTVNVTNQVTVTASLIGTPTAQIASGTAQIGYLGSGAQPLGTIQAASVIGQVTVTASVIGQPTVTVSVIGQPTVTASVIGNVRVDSGGTIPVAIISGGAGDGRIQDRSNTAIMATVTSYTSGIYPLAVQMVSSGGVQAAVTSLAAGPALKVDLVQGTITGADGAILDGTNSAIRATVASGTGGSALLVVVASQVGGGSTITGSVYATVLGTPTIVGSVRVSAWNTAIATTRVTVSASGTLLPTTALSNRTRVVLYNRGMPATPSSSAILYVGPTGASPTAACSQTGWPLEYGGTLELEAGPSIILAGATCGSGSNVNSGQEVAVMELS